VYTEKRVHHGEIDRDKTKEQSQHDDGTEQEEK
jgi:hypothetical protein